MKSLEILAPGPLSSIQDSGRIGLEYLGISPSGAADPIAFAVGNRLVDNSKNEAAIEMTWSGATVRFSAETTFALSGAPMAAELDGRMIKTHRSYQARPGEVLSIGPTPDGCRTYLCVQGGIQTAICLGSRSTHLQSGMGGHFGRPLMTGDVLEIGDAPKDFIDREINLDCLFELSQKAVLRVTESSHTAQLTEKAKIDFASQEYRVTEQMNRLGLRLEGQALSHVPEIPSTGVSLGSIQISPNGQPTILFVEGQLTGGYPLIACVASVDAFKLGQLRPRDRISFHWISFERALNDYREFMTYLASDGIFK